MSFFIGGPQAHRYRGGPASELYLYLYDPDFGQAYRASGPKNDTQATEATTTLLSNSHLPPGFIRVRE